MRPWQGTARELFESARVANAEIERINAQLWQMEQDALRVGGASFEPHVSGTHDPDRMARRVGAYVDREQQLRDRLDHDYELIDLACMVLYGKDNQHGIYRSMGLDGPMSADILWWRYCAGACWTTVSKKVFCSVRKCQYLHNEAMRHLEQRSIEAAIRGE